MIHYKIERIFYEEKLMKTYQKLKQLSTHY